jgi:hypothetical protein
MVAPLAKWMKPEAKSSTLNSVRSQSPQPPGMSWPLAKPVAPAAGDVVALGEVDHGRAADAHGIGEAHQPHAEVECVHADVHARPAAGDRVVDEGRLAGQPVAAHGVDARVVDLAERAAVGELAQRLGGTTPAHVLRGHQQRACLLRRRLHAPHLVAGDRERLLAQHVQPALERREHGWGVELVRRADVDGVEAVDGDEPAVVGEDAFGGHAEVLGEGLGGRPMAVADGDDLAVGDVLPTRHVRAAHDAAGADDADPELGHGMS